MAAFFVTLLTIIACTLGWLLTFSFLERASFWRRVCYGSVTGLLLLAWVSFLLALLIGLNAANVALTTVLMLVAAFFLYRKISSKQIKTAWQDGRSALKNKWSIGCYAVWAAFLTWLLSRVVTINNEGLQTSPANNFGDLPFHFSVINSFTSGENFPPGNPIFDGMRFTYPFLADFLTAFFRYAGTEWTAAFFISNIVLVIALIGIIETFAFDLTGNRLAARLTPLLFLFNGGFGFVYFFRDLAASGNGWLNFIAHLPFTYTMNDQRHLRWGNLFTTLLIPQRSLLFGLPVAAMIFTLWWWAVKERRRDGETEHKNEKTNRSVEEKPAKHSGGVFSDSLLQVTSVRRYFLAAGTLAGLLPLAHAHGFFSVMLISVVAAMVFFSFDWLWFFVPAGILSLPQAWWLSGTPTRSKLFTPHFGWEAGNEMSAITFWLLNAGAFLLLLIFALIVPRIMASRTKRFYLPFLVCFIVPNVMLLAPWPWDNIKVLVYWYLASCPLVAAVVARPLAAGFITPRIIGVALIIMLTFSGMLDVGRALSPVENVTVFGRAELEAAERIQQQIPPRSLIVNAPIHNSVAAMTGRRSLMGYPGHLWTHGIDYAQREADVRTIYGGGANAETLLQHYGVNYVVIGPIERAQFGANESYYATKYQAVVDAAGYRVYKIR
jgi:hypothetical protein